MQDPNQDFHQGTLIRLLKAVGEDNNLIARIKSGCMYELSRAEFSKEVAILQVIW